MSPTNPAELRETLSADVVVSWLKPESRIQIRVIRGETIGHIEQGPLMFVLGVQRITFRGRDRSLC